MNLLLKAVPSNPNYAEFGWLVLVLFEGNAHLKEIAHYRKKFVELAEDTDSFSDLTEFRFSVGNVVFYSVDAMYREMLPDVGPKAARHASVENLFPDPSATFVWVGKEKIFDDDDFCKTAEDTLIVTREGVRWTSEEECGDETSTSVTISYEDLFKGKL